MTNERAIWHAAGVLIEGHGEHAAIAAAQHAGEYLERGDMEERRLWIRITQAVASMIDVPQGMAN